MAISASTASFNGWRIYSAIIPICFSIVFTSETAEGTIGENFVNSIVHLVGSGWAKFIDYFIMLYMTCLFY